MPLFTRVNMKEIGNTGLKQSGGYVYEDPMPGLRGRYARRIYEEMYYNDDTVASVLYAIEMVIRRVGWFVQPVDDSPEEIDRADYMNSLMDDMSHSWESFITEVLTFLPYGWSYFETVYKMRRGEDKSPGTSSQYNDGRVGIRKLAIRGQSSLEKWEFDDEGGVAGMWQDSGVMIPIGKALLFRTRENKGNPEGQSVLRGAWRSWYFKKRIQEIEAVGIERDLVGIPIAWLDVEIMNSSDPDDIAIVDELEKIVVNIRRDEQEGAVIPLARDAEGNKLIEFELLRGGGQRQFDTDTTIQRYDRGIARVVLADFVLLGGGESKGSFALAKDKTDLFVSAMEAYLDAIAGVLNRHLIPRLFKMNGWQAPYPAFKHEQVQEVDIQKLGDFLQKMSFAGAMLFPDDELENHLRGLVNLPERSFPTSELPPELMDVMNQPGVAHPQGTEGDMQSDAGDQIEDED